MSPSLPKSLGRGDWAVKAAGWRQGRLDVAGRALGLCLGLLDPGSRRTLGMDEAEETL